MASEPPALPILVNGVQHDGRVWHFKRAVVLKPKRPVSLEAPEFETIGTGTNETEARRDWGAAFAILYDRLMKTPEEKLKASDRVMRRKVEALIDRVDTVTPPAA